MEITVNCYAFKDLSSLTLHQIYKLRCEVFVVEQQCAYADVDDKDLQAWHLCCFDNEQVIAYARLLPPGVSYESCSIGRVVVNEAYRHQKLGRKLMEEAIHYCCQLFNADTITISAQHYLQAFYESLGFTSAGSVYLEDDIPHIKMYWSKP